MAKVEIELVKIVLQRAEIEARKAAQIIDDLKFESKQLKGEDKESPFKKQFVAILNDATGKFEKANLTFEGWVFQIPIDAEPQSVVERLYKGVYDYNISPKGRRMPLKTTAEACEFGSANLYKKHKLWVKTKEPIIFLPIANKIPLQKQD